MNLTPKMEKRIKGGVVAFLALLFLTCTFLIAAKQYDWYRFFNSAPTQTVEIVRSVLPEAAWDYMDEGFEPGIGNVWATEKYDSSFWKSGSGVFKMRGSAPEKSTYPVVTLKTKTLQNTNAPTCFFRTTFMLEDEKSIQALQGNIHYSDAVIVYLNGSIIFAGNVPAGGYQSNQEATVAETIDGIQSAEFTVTNLEALKKGENILAVEVHQGSGGDEDAYFFFEYLDLLGTEQQETAPQVQQLVLEQGVNEAEVWVNWQTQAEGFYQVNYLEASEYEESPERFLSRSKQVLMGRTHRVSSAEGFVHKANLTRLKAATDYVYCILPVGGTQASEILHFRTGKRKAFSFALMGDPQIGAYDEDDTQRWDNAVTSTLAMVPETDFMLFAGDQVDGIGTDAEILEMFEIFRAPEALKRIPFKTVKGNHEAQGFAEALYDGQFFCENQNEQGDYWFTYQDTLFVGLNSNQNDFNAHKKYIQDAVSRTRRKWVVVLMHHSLFSGGNHAQDEDVAALREEYAQFFSDLDVDLVLSGHDHLYVRSQLMRGVTPKVQAETQGDETQAQQPTQDTLPKVQKKARGETLYITAGSSSGNKFYNAEQTATQAAEVAFKDTEHNACMTYVEMTEKQITLVTYRLADGSIIDSFSLQKETAANPAE